MRTRENHIRTHKAFSAGLWSAVWKADGGGGPSGRGGSVRSFFFFFLFFVAIWLDDEIEVKGEMSVPFSTSASLPRGMGSELFIALPEFVRAVFNCSAGAKTAGRGAVAMALCLEPSSLSKSLKYHYMPLRTISIHMIQFGNGF